MDYEQRDRFGFDSLAGGDAASFFRSTVPLAKRVPIFPLKTYNLDYYCSNRESLRTGCTTCFAFPHTQQTKEHYVDLLEFSNFGGVPTPLLPGVPPPKRWFADLRYAIFTPLPHSYPSVGREVLTSQRVSSAIENQIEAGCSLPFKELQRKARHYFTAMRASISRFVCKICGYLLFKVFRRLMTKMLVCPEQMKRLQEANATGLPLVYLPLHKSHLDYLMLTWTAWHFQFALPHIASGDNLNLSGLGWLLRATGAFFIRRRTDPKDTSGKDAIYRAVLHSYIEQLMSRGLPIEFFLEGTRSRFGKSLIPKHGLISNVVEAYQQGMIQDCYFVPVSYVYEDVAEGVFLDELMGVPKVRESVFGVFRGIWKGFRQSQRCGAVRMHFGQPVLLSHYIEALSSSKAVKAQAAALARIPHNFSYRELVPWHHEHQDRVDNRTLIRAIGYHAVHEAQSIVSISLPSVVSALLLCKFNMGVSDDVLASDIEWLCNQIIIEGSDIMGWNDENTSGSVALEHALKYLSHNVDIHGSLIKPLRSHRHLMHLAYHKNALVPLFAIKSAISMTLVCHNRESIKVRDLIQEAMIICDCLQFETIFSKPCVEVKDAIRHHLNKMCELGGPLTVITNDTDEDFRNTDKCTDASTIRIRDANSNLILIFYSNFLRPFLQSFYMVVDKLSQGIIVEKESQLIRTMCREFLASAGKLPFDIHLEAINSDSFKNSLAVLREKKIISNDVCNIQVLEPDQLAILKSTIQLHLKIFKSA